MSVAPSGDDRPGTPAPGDAPQAPAIGGDRWPRIIEQLEDGLLVLDRSGTIRCANAAAATLLGRPAAPLVGAPFGLPLTGPGITELELGPRGTPVRLRIVDAGSPGSFDGSTEAYFALVHPDDRPRILTLPEDPACVRGDVSQLRSALLSLVQNAGDALRGQGAIHLRVRRDLPPPLAA